MKEITLTDEQIKTIAHALRTTMRVNQESVDTMYQVCGVNNDTIEVANRIIEGNICMRTLLDYIESV